MHTKSWGKVISSKLQSSLRQILKAKKILNEKLRHDVTEGKGCNNRRVRKKRIKEKR